VCDALKDAKANLSAVVEQDRATSLLEGEATWLMTRGCPAPRGRAFIEEILIGDVVDVIWTILRFHRIEAAFFIPSARLV
jgi:hypothetical protein